MPAPPAWHPGRGRRPAAHGHARNSEFEIQNRTVIRALSRSRATRVCASHVQYIQHPPAQAGPPAQRSHKRRTASAR